MPSRSYLNLLDLAECDPGAPSPTSRRPARLPRVMTVPGILSDDSPDSPRATSEDRRIIVAHRLPLRAAPDPSSAFGLRFSPDPDALSLQLRSGLPPSSSVLHVGCLPVPVDSTTTDLDALSQHLLDRHRCLPVFLPPDLHHRFYHGFCKHHLWPLLHYLLPLSGASAFDPSHWRAYLSANRLFADRVSAALLDHPDSSYVWVHDYHLLALPTFLRRHHPRARLGFFLHSPFPSSEIFRALPVRDDILRALLNADLIGFHTFDYARHFLSACSRLLGLHYQSRRGHLSIDYYGRDVTVKILPVGIDLPLLRSVLSSPETVTTANELVNQRYHGRTLLLGIDDMDVFKGIALKFLAFEQLLEHHSDHRGRSVLVQIANPARSVGRDIQEVQEETRSTAIRINSRFGSPGYTPIVLIDDRPVSTHEKAAYYAAAECCIVSAVRDGMNLVPYKYTACRQGSPALEGKKKKSVIVVSEFIGCSPSLSGAIRVNPWNVEAMSEAMNLALSMPEAEKELRHEKHYKYVSSHDVAYWARSFDQDLQRACRDHFMKRCWGIGFGLSFRVVALGPSFRKLSVEHIVAAYRRTNSRLILLDYDGTMMPETSINKAPSNEVISLLNDLCADPKNVVFIVSGRDRDTLSKWFAPCDKLGISAEHGYFTRWTRDSPWESCQLIANFDWKKIVEPVMRQYTEATDGSYIEHKESALVWHYQEADPDFGSWQAKELLDHLESVLANEPVTVKKGQQIVEVNPQGISKGVGVENLISSMVSKGKPADFVLCVGDDQSDEDMFESITAAGTDNSSVPAIAEVFACTVGRKPSKAKYFLDDTVDVIKMLQGLATASARPPRTTSHQQVSFEGFH